jgi:hypothetical protein
MGNHTLLRVIPFDQDGGHPSESRRDHYPDVSLSRISFPRVNASGAPVTARAIPTPVDVVVRIGSASGLASLGHLFRPVRRHLRASREIPNRARSTYQPHS